MSRKQKTNVSRRQYWQGKLESWRAGGLSVRQFCKRQGVSEPSFYCWRKKLAKDGTVNCGKEPRLSSSFIEVALPGDKPVTLELVLASGHTLRIVSGIDSETLTNVLSALSGAGLC